MKELLGKIKDSAVRQQIEDELKKTDRCQN